MPNFDEETIARWRQDRISEPYSIPDSMPLTEWQINQMLGVTLQDLSDEENNLRCALATVSQCRKNIRNLKKKRDAIQKRAGGTPYTHYLKPTT